MAVKPSDHWISFGFRCDIIHMKHTNSRRNDTMLCSGGERESATARDRNGNRLGSRALRKLRDVWAALFGAVETADVNCYSLVRLGPGGSYVREYIPDRDDRKKLNKVPTTAFTRSLFDIELVSVRALALGVAQQAQGLGADSMMAFDRAHDGGSLALAARRDAATADVRNARCSGPLKRKDSTHESHTETASHPETHSRLAGASWLFADDAGARRREWPD